MDGFRTRLKWVFSFIFLFGAILITRLFFVQIVKADYYKAEANKQYILSPGSIFSRGTIYFSSKDGRLVSAATLKKTEEPVKYKRYYPANNLASKVLGFVGYKENSLVGRYGVEQQYENVLGQEGGQKSVNFFAEIFSDIKSAVSGDFEKGDIVLTIEPLVQSYLEQSLDKILGQYKAELAGGIIIEPKTGKVLAMAAKPDFNPNYYGQEKDLNIFSNPAVQNIYEMGSIMKPLTIAAALDQKKISVNTSYFDNGFVEIGRERIENFDKKAHGQSTIQDILNNSINTGAVFVMQKMGRETFKDYLAKYGFGEKTGIDLPGEVSGKISNVISSPREIEPATASFGQGFAVTPIEMAVALSSLANGGSIMKPYIVSEIKIRGLANKKTEPEILRQVIKKETAEEVSRMLSKLFDEVLGEGRYKMEHYFVAAKTGTAQYVKEGEKGYEKGEYVHTFFGYAPAFDAKFLTLFFLVKPQGVKYSSQSLTEPFVNITKFLLNYYEVPPDR